MPGYEAPVYIAWARRNRSALVRVPMYKPGKENATRVEFRCPDPACNPYLAFAVMLAAGLKGIEEGLRAARAGRGEHLRDDRRRSASRRHRDPARQPEEAIEVTEKSELVRETLGDHIFDEAHREQEDRVGRLPDHVSKFELDNYLPLL